MEFEADVRVTIDPIEQAKIWYYVDKCPKEISGLGKVIRLDDGTFHVTKVYLLQQECTAVETELDDKAISQLLFESKDDPGELLFWWHSHVNMNVFWSGTDMNTIHQLGKSGLIISTVYNKKREHRTSLYVASNGYNPQVFIDDLTIEPAVGLTKLEMEDLDTQYDEKVTFPAAAPSYGGYRGWQGGYSNWYDTNDDYPSLITGQKETPKATSMGDLYDQFQKLTKPDRKMFKEAYESWNGPDLDMSHMDKRRDFYEFCEYYDFNTDKLEEDWGYSAICSQDGVL